MQSENCRYLWRTPTVAFPGITECYSDACGEAVWIVVTPDRHVQIELTRGGAVPRMAAVTPLFAEAVDAELEGLHVQAARLAAIICLVAGVAVAAPAARWRIADTSAARLVQELATDPVLSPATGVARGSVGLVHSGEPPRGLFCESVPNAELGAWEAGNHAGAGRDLAAPALINAGSVMSLGVALASFRPRELKDITHWPHEEPRAGIDPRAGGRSYHLPRPVAVTIRGSLRSDSVLGTQTLVSDPGTRHTI